MYFNFTRSYVLVYYSKNDFVHNLMSIALLLIIQKDCIFSEKFVSSFYL